VIAKSNFRNGGNSLRGTVANPQGFSPPISEIFLASSIDPAFDLIHARVMIETQAEHIFDRVAFAHRFNQRVSVENS